MKNHRFSFPANAPLLLIFIASFAMVASMIGTAGLSKASVT